MKQTRLTMKSNAKRVTRLILIVLILTLVLLLAAKTYISNRRIFTFARQINGPIPLPLIGNAHLLLGNTDDTMKKILQLSQDYGTPTRFWLGNYLTVIFTAPKHVERILSSTKVIHKHDLYDQIKSYGGEGMITGSGPEWKHARKLNLPIYNAKFIEECIPIMQHHIENFIEIIYEKSENDFFDIQPMIHDCILDIIGESILGMNFECQSGNDKFNNLMKAMKTFYDHILYKIIKPWTYYKFLYEFTKMKKQEDENVRIMNGAFQQCLDNLRAGGENVYVSSANKNFVPSSLEFMRAYEKDPGCLNDNDFRDNLMTLWAASEDTITAIVAAACLCLGMYPRCQEKAVEELVSVLGSSFTRVTFDDINKLTYLDMCVNETLRLFPIAPFIFRKTTCDFKIDKWVIPEGCGLMISIFSVHLNADEWEKAMEFYPEHFTSDAVAKRHVYSFIPFSAGPRGCIGKIFAKVAIKIILAHILQRYVLEADGTYEDVFKRLKSDISVRPRDGYLVKIRRRY